MGSGASGATLPAARADKAPVQGRRKRLPTGRSHSTAATVVHKAILFEVLISSIFLRYFIFIFIGFQQSAMMVKVPAAGCFAAPDTGRGFKPKAKTFFQNDRPKATKTSFFQVGGLALIIILIYKLNYGIVYRWLIKYRGGALSAPLKGGRAPQPRYSGFT